MMDMTARRHFVALLLAVCLSGCATIVNGPTQEVTFETYPPGADLAVDGVRLGTTPMSARLRRDQDGETLIYQTGREPVRLRLTHSLSGWFLLNLPIIGWVVDYATGAMWNIDPDRYYVPLRAAPAAFDTAERARRFIELNYGRLLADLMGGGGKVLLALFDEIGVPYDNRQDAFDLLRTLSTFYKSPPVFAERAAQELVYRGYVDNYLKGR